MLCPSCNKYYGTNVIECEKCLEYLNWVNLCVTPHHRIHDSEQNQGHALENATKFVAKFLHEATLEDLFKYLQRAQAISAAFSLAYNQKKVVERVPDPQAIESLPTSEWQEALKKQKLAQRPKKEKILISAREKAINQLLSLKMDRATAERIVDEQMSKEGRNPGVN